MSSIIKDSATLSGSRSRLVPAMGAGVEVTADLKTLPGFGAAGALSGFTLSGFILSGLVAGLRGFVGTDLVVGADDEEPSLIEIPEADGAAGIALDGSEAADLLREREILTGSPSGR